MWPFRPARTRPAVAADLSALRVNGVALAEVLGGPVAASGGAPAALGVVEIGVGFCHVCGERTAFYGYDPLDFPCKRNSFVCRRCGACGRNRHVARCILRVLPLAPPAASLRDFAARFDGPVFAACTTGAIADTLRGMPGFVASEYIDGVPSGATKGGVLCQDLQATSFADASFDLVITEDVLEHVAEPRRAFAEIRRILRPGGWHVGTIPVNWGRPHTTARAVLEDGQVRHLLPPEYHGDPTRPDGILAFTEFGQDVAEWCGLIGPTEIDSAHEDLAQELAFGIYNSWVFLSRKAGGGGTP